VDSILLLAEVVSDDEVPLVWGMPLWAAWIVIGALLIFTGMFSACENAYSTCNKYHFRAEAEKGKRYAKIITSLVDRFDNSLVAILVTSNTLATLMSFISAMVWLQISKTSGWADGVEAIISTVVMGFLFYVVADTIPKVISRAIPDKIAVLMAYPLRVLQIILFPIIWVFKKLLAFIHKKLHLKDESLLSKEDLLFEANQAINDDADILEDEESEEEPEKLFEKDETEIFNHVLSFDEMTVAQVYVPLRNTFALDINGLTASRVNKVIEETNYSRIPIFDEEKRDIIGVLVLRIYFEEYMKDKHLSIPSILEGVVEIPFDMKLDDALEELNSQKLHLGVVKKDGEVMGIITMEDILEEVVNDISETPTHESDMEVEHE
jgi:CBS domain containing-hemolysin-like protein